MMKGKRTKVVNPQLPPFHCLFVAGDSDGPSVALAQAERSLFERQVAEQTAPLFINRLLYSTQQRDCLAAPRVHRKNRRAKVSGTTEPISTKKKMKFIDSITPPPTLLQFFLVNLSCASRRSRLLVVKKRFRKLPYLSKSSRISGRADDEGSRDRKHLVDP